MHINRLKSKIEACLNLLQSSSHWHNIVSSDTPKHTRTIQKQDTAFNGDAHEDVVVSRAAESESRPQLESVGVGHFGRIRSQRWSR